MSKENIYNRLMDAIGNKYGVCGLMGNIQAESGMVSTNMQNSYESRLEMNDTTYTQAVDSGSYTNFVGDRVGYGLCQWTSSGRKNGLLNYARSTGRSIGDENMQIEYLLHELSTSYKYVLDVLKTATSVKEASDIVITKYERPASVGATASEATRNKALATRQKLGEEIYKQYCTEESEEKPMATKIIALDAGHGMSTSGKRCMKAIDPNETREWYLNDRISDRLEELLADYDCKVVRVGDTTGKKDISMAQRVKTANNINADAYVSVHHNAGLNGRKGGGTVVYYYSSKAERKTQAESLYNEVVNRTGLVGNRSSKVIKKGFYVIRNTSMPAFLIENGFMDSYTDVPIILTAEHAEKTAQGILAFLVKNFALVKKVAENGANTKPQTQPSDDGELPMLRKGSKGTAVKVWQIIVGTTADGVFGNDTENATKTFQKNNGLTVDGIVSEKSWEAGLDSLH